MKLSDLLSWQWSAYPATHRRRINLLIHLVTWPFFVSGVLMILTGMLSLQPDYAIIGLLAAAGATIAQLRSHRFEPQSLRPFDGPFDLMSRFLAEQFITFPRFLFSGGFARAWREAGDKRESA